MAIHEGRPALYEDCVGELAPAVSKEEDCYLTPALEGLLIETLDPRLNVHKKQK